MKCHDPCPYTISCDICSRCKLGRSARRYVDATFQECCSIYFLTEDGGSRFLPHKHGSKAHTSSGDPARGSNDRRVERDLQRFVGRQTRTEPSRELVRSMRGSRIICVRLLIPSAFVSSCVVAAWSAFDTLYTPLCIPSRMHLQASRCSHDSPAVRCHL